MWFYTQISNFLHKVGPLSCHLPAPATGRAGGRRPLLPLPRPTTHGVGADDVALGERLAVVFEFEIGGELGRAAVAVGELVLT